MNRLISIQCLRFAAASAVVVTHCSSGKFLFGSFGVDLFFIISGFIITKVMNRRAALPFLKDRFSRIYPIYWLCLLPLIIANWDGDLLRLMTSITLWPVFGEFRRGFLEVGWTLHFEMLFYLAATVVVWRRWMLPLLLVAYGIALVGGLISGNALLGFLGSPMIIEFLMGVGLALAPSTRLPWPGAAAILVGLAAAVWGSTSDFGAIQNMFNGVSAWRWAQWGIPALMIVWGSIQFEELLKGRLFRFGAAGGDASYALYLSHPAFLLIAPTNPYLLLAIGPPVLIALGFLVHYRVEMPLLRLVRRALARKDRGAAAIDVVLADP